MATKKLFTIKKSSMKKLNLSITILLSFIFIGTYAQPWMNSIEKEKRGDANFYEVQKAFNAYWKDKKIEKGKGWKQFKRWEEFMEPRVYPSGKIPKDILWEEYQKIKNENKSTTANWTHMGPTDTPTDIYSGDRRGSGRVNCIEFHPTDPLTFWVGAPSGGVWKTTDGGNTWITTTDDLISIGISDIAVNPTNPNILYVATGDGDASDTYSIGILKSTDGGTTWNTTGSVLNITDFYVFRRILINPNNTNIIIATSNNGILRSTDAGVTWTNVQTGNFKDLEFKPGDPSVVYATRNDAGVYKSSNSGNSFTNINGTINSSEINRIELGVTPANPNVIYALCSSSSDNGFYALYKSSNSGSSWTMVTDNTSINLMGWDQNGSDSGGQGWYDLSCAVDPTNENVVYTGGVNIWKTTDSGISWNINAHWYGAGGNQYVHADQHTLDFNLLNNTLYSGNDGGLYKTNDGGAIWMDISDGLEILQIYRIGNSYTNSDIVVGGCQDNGTMKRNTGVWNSILGGDGMECMVDYTNENIIYAEYYYGNMYRSNDGGVNFTDIKPSGTGNGAWITPYIMHPTINTTIYAGFDEVYKSTNSGNTWTTISSGLTGGGNLRNIDIAPSDDQYIYAATNSEIWRTINGGTSWTNITNNLPSNSITDIAISPNNPNMIWVSLSGYDSGEKVYTSNDGGSTWTNFSTGLPNIPANTIIYENNTNNALYCGTDLGVYYRNGAMSSWTQFSDGLPNVIVNELEIHYPSKKLRAGTYGRGLWQTDLYSNPAVPVANFSYYVVSNCNGNVSFSDLSSGVPDTWHWDFGDGNTSAQQHPNHTYNAIGNYNVELIISNSFGSDTFNLSVNLSVGSTNTDFVADQTSFCSAPVTINFTNLTTGTNTFIWDFGDGNTSTDISPSHTYNIAGDFTVSLVSTSALCPNDTLVMTSYISIDPGNSTIELMPESGQRSSNCCTGTLKDSGGDNNYSNNTLGYFTIAPPNATQITITFNMLDVEQGDAGYCNYDFIGVYDGPNAASPLIGNYCNTTGNPGTITSSGGSITLKQYSDGYVEGAGYIVVWDCLINNKQEIEQNEVNIYPNPTTGEIIIKADQILKIEIINLNGQIVFTEFYSNVGGQNMVSCNLKHQPKGLYLINVICNNDTFIEKIVVE